MTAIGPTLALLGYAVRLDSRAIGTYLLRLALGVTILFYLWTTVGRTAWMSAPGRTFFLGVLWVDLFFITLAGVGVFSAAITEEKEEGTLGLLRMTRLSPVAILLGKGGSRLFTAALLLAAQAPFTLLAITLGGVSLEQIVAAYAAMLAYLFFLANLGLLASVMFARTNRAAGMTGLALLALLVGPWFVRGLLESLVSGFSISRQSLLYQVPSLVISYFTAASPFTRANAIMSTGFAGPIMEYQVWSNLGAGAALFALAWLWLSYSALEPEPMSTPRAFTLPRPGKRLRAGRAWTGTRALVWKEIFFTSGGSWGLVTKLAVYLLVTMAFVLVAAMSSRRPPSVEDIGEMLMGWFLFALALECLVICSNVFNSEMKWKTLTSLATLPMPMGRIALAKSAGAAVGLLPALAMFCLGVLLAPGSFFDVAEEFFDHIMPTYLVVCVLTTLVLTAYLSLHLRWGAAVAAVASVFFCNMVSWIVMSSLRMRDEEVIATLLMLVMGAASVVMAWRTPRLMARAAAES